MVDDYKERPRAANIGYPHHESNVAKNETLLNITPNSLSLYLKNISYVKNWRLNGSKNNTLDMMTQKSYKWFKMIRWMSSITHFENFGVDLVDLSEARFNPDVLNCTFNLKKFNIFQ